MNEGELKINHLVFGFSVGAMASYVLIVSPLIIGDESAFTLIMFNFLFVALTFPLNGKLTRKLFLLLLGNIVGLLWNNLFSLLAHTVTGYLGENFKTLYVVTNPFLNLFWIVSFFSISLTILVDSNKRKRAELYD